MIGKVEHARVGGRCDLMLIDDRASFKGIPSFFFNISMRGSSERQTHMHTQKRDEGEEQWRGDCLPPANSGWYAKDTRPRDPIRIRSGLGI